MNKAIYALLALLMLAGAVYGALAEATAVDYATGTPWLCSDLEGVVTEDTPASLKDDFALAVNKDALLALEIPEGYSYGGTLMDVSLKQADDIRNMFLGDAPQGHDALLAYNLFWLMMDWDSRNALGVAPLKEEIDRVEAVDTLDAMSAYFLELPVESQAGKLWAVESEPDLADSTRRILSMGSCPLLLEDSAEYAAMTDYGAVRKAAATELTRKMLMKLGYSEADAAQKIENCFAFEAKVAPVIYTNEEQRSADYYNRTYNLYTRDALMEAQGKLPVIELMEHMGYPATDRYQVDNPAFLDRLNEVYTEENLPLIRDYLIVHDVIDVAARLDRECYEWKTEYNNALDGATGIVDDATASATEVSKRLEWPVAQLYTETYLKAEDKERIAGMVDDILKAYHGILEEADFLSDETRARAIEKLDAMNLRVLYPDDWEKYSCDGLEIGSPQAGETYWQAVKKVLAYQLAKKAKEYSEPVDWEKWVMPPQIVNCFYDPQGNSINILGAFTQGSLYNSDMSDEELLAKVGTTIGHEISHGFDRTGAQFDKDGNMANWWTDEDYQKFTERNARLAAYYDAMHPWAGQSFHGSIMTGEACADMAGMKVALRIAAQREGFDYDAFFRAYANTWLMKMTLQQAYTVINDNHPMCYLRINCTLQQYDEFLDTYGIAEGDNMYLAPEDRVAVW